MPRRRNITPPPSRGRLGGGWGYVEMTTETHPHPNPPLEGEGVSLQQLGAGEFKKIF